MNYEKAFQEFLNKDGNEGLDFLRRYATMDDRKVIEAEGFYLLQAERYLKLALHALGEYEMANYAKYLHAHNFKMGEFKYCECVATDIDGLFASLMIEARKRLEEDCDRLKSYQMGGNAELLEDNIFTD